LVEEILRHHSFQSVAWILLAALSQFYSENWEQKAQQNFRGQERSQLKVLDKESMIAEDICPLNKSQVL
jgi:hypothetical protein